MFGKIKETYKKVTENKTVRIVAEMAYCFGKAYLIGWGIGWIGGRFIGKAKTVKSLALRCVTVIPAMSAADWLIAKKETDILHHEIERIEDEDETEDEDLEFLK